MTARHETDFATRCGHADFAAHGQKVRRRRVAHHHVEVRSRAEVDSALAPKSARNVHLEARERARSGVVTTDGGHAPLRPAKNVHAQPGPQSFDGAERRGTWTAHAYRRDLARPQLSLDAPTDFRTQRPRRRLRVRAIDLVARRADQRRRAASQPGHSTRRATDRLEHDALEAIDARAVRP